MRAEPRAAADRLRRRLSATLALDRRHTMNVFELATVVSPVAGLAGGMHAANGHAPALTVSCAGAGLLIGGAIYPGLALLAVVVGRRLRDQRVSAPESLSRHRSWAETVVLLWAFVAPFAAWVASGAVASWLLAVGGAVGG